VDTDLLILFKDKATFQRFKPFIKEHVLLPETQLIINSIDSYYKAFPHTTTMNWEAFASYFFVLRNSQIPKAEVANYRAILDKVAKATPTHVANDVLAHFVTQDFAHRIADTALSVKEGTASIDDVHELVKQHDKELGRAIKVEDLFVTGDIDDVLEEAKAPGFEWRLEELNVSCGPLRKGDFVMVAAYVETGKTTFAASEVSHMASQIKDNRPVVWINNEERSIKVKLRIMQAALGLTSKDIDADRASAKDAYKKLMGGDENRILVQLNDNATNHVDRLIPMLRDLNPALIVFDQLDKVNGFHSRDEKEHMRLGRLYKWARELSHEYGPVIAISQCDASSGASQYIRMDQLRGSKVDKPGEADAIITIGKDDNPANINTRYIHVPKNKLTGGPRSVESERHGYFEVKIKPEIARYEGTR
jgi:replicative DNA helicase